MGWCQLHQTPYIPCLHAVHCQADGHGTINEPSELDRQQPGPLSHLLGIWMWSSVSTVVKMASLMRLPAITLLECLRKPSTHKICTSRFWRLRTMCTSKSLQTRDTSEFSQSRRCMRPWFAGSIQVCKRTTAPRSTQSTRPSTQSTRSTQSTTSSPQSSRTARGFRTTRRKHSLLSFHLCASNPENTVSTWKAQEATKVCQAMEVWVVGPGVPRKTPATRIPRATVRPVTFWNRHKAFPKRRKPLDMWLDIWTPTNEKLKNFEKLEQLPFRQFCRLVGFTGARRPWSPCHQFHRWQSFCPLGCWTHLWTAQRVQYTSSRMRIAGRTWPMRMKSPRHGGRNLTAASSMLW